MSNMSDLEDLQRRVIKFRDERDWKQFHNPKDTALSLVLEASEYMEHYQWKTSEEVKQHVKDRKEDLEDEVADVFYYLFLIAEDLNIDLASVLIRKLEKNEKRYPVDKSKGSHKKYTELS